jgi:ribosome-binding protein aMBF1 (putative translation factor)
MRRPMFRDLRQELEAEAKVEGPGAVEELETFRNYFRLARELAEARKAKGFSQQQLAERCGLNQSEISDIERGRANPWS